MLAKIVFLIVSMATIACTVLAIRQSRLQTASEIVQAQVRINAMDERLAALRIAVAERVAPEKVREMAADMADLIPLAQAAGDAAREAREHATPPPVDTPRQQRPSTRTPPQADPNSHHNPDGTPREPSRRPSTRRSGGAA